MSEIKIIASQNWVNEKISTATSEAKAYTDSAIVDFVTRDEIYAVLGGQIVGAVDENNNIVITGNLADGTYTLKYEYADGNLTEIGTVDIGDVSPAYTNLFDPSTATLNTRMSGGSSASKAADGYVMTAAITIPETSITGATAGDAYIAVPASMWANSANVFLLKNDVVSSLQGYMDVSGSPGTVSGDWVKIPLLDKWGTTFTAAGVIVSLYVSASAITASDIANIAIYYNECPV